VFVILARKAASLGPGVVLSGWLYQTTRLTAANFVKREIHRQQREQEAYMQSTVNEPTTAVWEKVAPLLEEAMGRLGATDRNALVLRFFENKTAREIAATLKLNEAAAHKRVSRALDKLRKFFVRRGVALSAAAIGSAVSAHSVQAAPAGLAHIISAAALAKGAAAGGSTLTLARGALKIMAWTKAKMAVVTGVAVLLAAGTTTVTVKELDAHRIYDWQQRFDLTMLDKMPPQATIRPAPPTRSAAVYGYGTSHGKALALGYDFNEMVRTIYQTDREHLRVAAPVPPGKYDYLANLPGANWMQVLPPVIRRQFGLAVRTEHEVETNVLILTRLSGEASGLKPNSDPSQWGPQLKAGPELSAGSFSCHGGLWMLVQALEDHLGTILVDRTGLTNHFDINLHWDGSPDGLERALRDQLGLALAPATEPVVVAMTVVEKAAKPLVQTLQQQADVQPDGTIHFQATIRQTNRTGKTLQTDYIGGIPALDRITDESGQPMKFTTQPNGNQNAVIVPLNQPVPPGGQFAYTIEFTLTNLIQPTMDPGVFVYQVQDLGDECITHSVEEYRLPPGAVLLAKQPNDCKVTTREGRPTLRIDRMIQPGGERNTEFRYRLAAVQ
jgi:uncharacterized protein (TIGR03435 family)